MILRWLPRASADARDIWLYIAQDSPVHADEWLERLLVKVDWIREHPHAGVGHGHASAHLRSIKLGNYRIFYRPSDEAIEILRVIHSARDLRRVAFD